MKTRVKCLWVFLCVALVIGATAGLRASEPSGTIQAGAIGPLGPPPPAPLAQGEYRNAEATSGIRVLLAGNEGSTDYGPLYTALAAYPDISTVAWFDTTSQVPTLSQLQAYDVVIVWTNGCWSHGADLGSVLADYLDAGGKVVVSTFAWQYFNCNALEGRFVAQGYIPLQGGNGDHYSGAVLGTYNASSPIMQGVTSAYDEYRDYTSLTPGATLVASWSDGENLVATKGCVVAINAYPGPYYRWGPYTSQMVTMYHNAVGWLMASCSSAPTYDLSFLDDLGRSSLCLNSTSGSYLWKILKGPGVGTSYTGTGQVANTAKLLTLTNTPGASQRISLNYYKLSKSASGYCQSSAQYSCLVDANTANDPPCR